MTAVVADVVAELLDRHVHGPVFGVLGEGTLAVVDRLVHRHRRRYVAAAREDGAVGMADAHARVSGQVSLAAVTHGPGLTNAVTALTEAARARTPMVVLAGDTPATADDNPQRLDQAAVVAPTGARFHPVRSAATAADDITRALRVAVLERCPVVLDLDTSLLQRACALPGADRGLGLVRPTPVAPADDVVGEVLATLAAARRPVVLAGRGAIGARGLLVGLADAVDARLATTLLAKGLFAGECADIGVCGGFATPDGAAQLASADLVIAVGASLNRFTRDDGKLLADADIIHVDADAGRLSSTPGTLAVHADAAAFCRAALDRLPLDGPARWENGPSQCRHGERRADQTGPSDEVGGVDAASPAAAGADLHDIVAWLDETVPVDRTVVVDGGHAALSEPARTMRVASPDAFVFPLHFGSIGLSVSAAIGATVAAPQRPTVCFTGDGGFLMCLAELDTIARLRLPITLVVMNDSAYGWEFHQMSEAGIDTELSRFERPSFASIARGFGIDAATVDAFSDLEQHAARIAAPSGPFLLDVHLDRNVRTAWYAAHAAAAVPMSTLTPTPT